MIGEIFRSGRKKGEGANWKPKTQGMKHKEKGAKSSQSAGSKGAGRIREWGRGDGQGDDRSANALSIYQLIE